MKPPLPPQNLEAETAVLGGVLLDSNCLGQVGTWLDASDFYKQSHRLIFEACQDLSAHGHPVDLITVTNILRERGKLEGSGGATYLALLADNVVTTANIGFYCRIVKEKSLSRQLISSATAIVQKAYEQSLEIDDLLSSAYEAINHVGKRRHGSKDELLTLQDMAEAYKNYVGQLSTRRFVTGFPELDGIIRGVAPGETLFIIAYSGLFKSAWLHNIFLNACRRTKQYHLFFSLEMPAVRVFERTCQIALEEYSYRVESGFHHHAGYEERTMERLTELGADKLIVCEKGGLTIEKIEHYTRMALQKYGAIGAIGIDYLGLMKAYNVQKEYDRISYVAENSKQIAKRLNVPVVALGQINRNSADGPLEMWSAKGSGAIEASADYLLGFYSQNKEMILKLLKNRNGEKDLAFRVSIDKQYLKFRGLEPNNDITAKHVERGRSRTRRKTGAEEACENDPY